VTDTVITTEPVITGIAAEPWTADVMV
jgi:hypothetical protein